MDLLYILGYYSTACVYFYFRWGPFVHSLGIVQWNFTRRDHPGNPGRVSGSGPVRSPLTAYNSSLDRRRRLDVQKWFPKAEELEPPQRTGHLPF